MSPPVRHAVPALLLAAAAAALAVRGVSIAQPLGIDQSLWASAVRGMSRGQHLYVDVWEQRPPGIYWVYLAGFRALGWDPATIAWLDVLASASTALLLFLIGRTLAGSVAGAVAAALYTVLTMPAALYGHGGFLERSVSETFIVVCVSGAAWFAARLHGGYTDGRAVAVGVCAGAAVVFKPNAALYYPAFLLWLLWYGRTPSGSGGVPWMRGLVISICASAVAPLAAVLWLWQHGALAEAKVAVVDFNHFYVAEGFAAGPYARAFSEAVWLRMKTQPLWAAGGVAALAAGWELLRTRTLPPLAGLAVLWGAASVLVIAANGARLFNSYFIQAMPPLALISAWLLTVGVSRSTVRQGLAIATLGLIAVLGWHRGYLPRVYEWARADYAVLTGVLDRTDYLDRFGGYANNRGYSARANAELAAYIRAHTGPDDAIFLFGINGAGVYFAADRLIAHRFLRVNFFVESTFPDPRFRLPAVVDALEARRPRYIIFEQLHSRSPMGAAADHLQEDPTVARLLQHYRRETSIEDFTLYRLHDSTTRRIEDGESQ